VNIDQFREQTKQKLAEWFSERLDREIFGMLTKEPEPLFTDTSGGFCFTTSTWIRLIRDGDCKRFMQDAIKHRDEALSRKVQCRLDGRKKEADHWHACMRFLENNFKIEPAKVEDE